MDKRENEGIFFGESCNIRLLGAASRTLCAVPWLYAQERLQLLLAQPQDQGQIGAMIASVSLYLLSWFRGRENDMNMAFPSSFWQGNCTDLIFLKTCLNCFWFSAAHLSVLLGLVVVVFRLIGLVWVFFWKKLLLSSWLHNFRLLWTAGFVKQQL